MGVTLARIYLTEVKLDMIYIAEKTLEKINVALKADQGASFRVWLGRILPHMKDAYSPDNDPFRSHLGASLIGRECARELWYSFHWTTRNTHEGRILRLFNRGHLEEARFLALLAMIGCDVFQQDANGNQFRISHADGHFGGSGDGICVGLPDVVAGMPVICEFKTHNSKSFAKLVSDGVQASKPEHYVQMNIYMRKMGFAAALYMAVNKDTDEIHAEIVPLDTETADRYLDRGEKIVWADTPPPKINSSPGFFKCKFCDHRPVCHLRAEPDRNCRTCQSSTPIEGGVWACRMHDVNIDKEQQLMACEDYAVRKDL